MRLRDKAPPIGVFARCAMGESAPRKKPSVEVRSVKILEGSAS
jgi:hypothetical protein